MNAKKGEGIQYKNSFDVLTKVNFYHFKENSLKILIYYIRRSQQKVR